MEPDTYNPNTENGARIIVVCRGIRGKYKQNMKE